MNVTDAEIKARLVEVMGHLPLADQGAHAIRRLRSGDAWWVRKKGDAITGMEWITQPTTMAGR